MDICHAHRERGRAIHCRHDQENVRDTNAATAEEKKFHPTQEEITDPDADCDCQTESIALSDCESHTDFEEKEGIAHSDSIATAKEKRFAESDPHADPRIIGIGISDNNADTLTHSSRYSVTDRASVADGIAKATRRAQCHPYAGRDQRFRELPTESAAAAHNRAGADHARSHLHLRFRRSG